MKNEDILINSEMNNEWNFNNKLLKKEPLEIRRFIQPSELSR